MIGTMQAWQDERLENPVTQQAPLALSLCSHTLIMHMTSLVASADVTWHSSHDAMTQQFFWREHSCAAARLQAQPLARQLHSLPALRMSTSSNYLRTVGRAAQQVDWCCQVQQHKAPRPHDSNSICLPAQRYRVGNKRTLQAAQTVVVGQAMACAVARHSSTSQSFD
jgi:hypothetical protein